MSDDKTDKEIVLSVDDIDKLTIDEILDLKVNLRKDGDLKLKVVSPFTKVDNVNIEWNSEGELSINKKKADEIMANIKAIKLYHRILNENKESWSKLDKFKQELLDKDINISQIESAYGFNDSSPKLQTCKDKFNFLTEKLKIEDVNEIIFTLVALIISDYKEKKNK